MVNAYQKPPPTPYWIRGVAFCFVGFGMWLGFQWDKMNQEELGTFKNKTFLYGYGYRPMPEEVKDKELLTN